MTKINRIILSEIHKLNEYLTRDVVSLYNYFNLTDDEKKEALVYEYIYLLPKFFKKNKLPLGSLKKYDDSYYTHEVADWLKNTNKEIFVSFGDYLYDKIINFKFDIPYSEYPTWVFFSKPTIIKNQWLIHQTEDADSIANEGFIYGVDDYTKLGLTTHLSQFNKEIGGYNFSYTLQDYLKYGKIFGSNKYGDEAVVFRASGLRLWHYQDEEYQTIFYGNTAKDIIPITHYTSTYMIHSIKTNNVLYESETMDDAVIWLINNFGQYRKHLIG